MLLTSDDANVSTRLSIKLIRQYEHKIYRLSISNNKSDLLYAKDVDELSFDKIIEFLCKFNYITFNKLNEIEKENIFNELMNLFKSLILDSDNLRLKYIKEHFRE